MLMIFPPVARVFLILERRATCSSKQGNNRRSVNNAAAVKEPTVL